MLPRDGTVVSIKPIISVVFDVKAASDAFLFYQAAHVFSGNDFASRGQH